MAGVAGRAAGACCPIGSGWRTSGCHWWCSTLQTADPERALAELVEPVGRLAAEHGLDSHLGKLVLELRPRAVQGDRPGGGC